MVGFPPLHRVKNLQTEWFYFFLGWVWSRLGHRLFVNHFCFYQIVNLTMGSVRIFYLQFLGNGQNSSKNRVVIFSFLVSDCSADHHVDWKRKLKIF